MQNSRGKCSFRLLLSAQLHPSGPPDGCAIARPSTYEPMQAPGAFPSYYAFRRPGWDSNRLAARVDRPALAFSSVVRAVGLDRHIYRNEICIPHV